MPDLPVLYLDNGAALCRSPQQSPPPLLFGDCRCGRCCPNFYIEAQLVGAPKVDLARAKFTQYEWLGGSTYTLRTVTAEANTSSGWAYETASILSHRKHVPCGVIAAQGVANLSCTAGGWFSSLDCNAEVNGVHRGGRHLFIRLGINRTLQNKDQSSYTLNYTCKVDIAECNSCAKYHISAGGVKTAGTEPSTISKTVSAVVLPNEKKNNILGIELTETVPGGDTKTFGMWWEYEFWLDAQYDQGLIVP